VEEDIASEVHRRLRIRPFSDENGERSIKAQIRTLRRKCRKDEMMGNFKEAKKKISEILRLWNLLKFKRSITEK